MSARVPTLSCEVMPSSIAWSRMLVARTLWVIETRVDWLSTSKVSAGPAGSSWRSMLSWTPNASSMPTTRAGTKPTRCAATSYVPGGRAAKR